MRAESQSKTYMMRVSLMLIGTSVLLFGTFVTPSQAQDKDHLTEGSVWKGEITQDDRSFPTTIYFTARDDERVEGEVHFEVDDELHILTFEGRLEGSVVAWITNKKEGPVTFPGLYVGTISDNVITGTWQVPSAEQYDPFSVTLVE